MDATELFLRDHARVHSTGVGEAEGGLHMGNLLLDGLTDEQARVQPAPGTNSIVWILLHMARSEDMGVNILVAGRKQVIESDGWIERLGLTHNDIGTGMTDDEVANVSSRVNLAPLRDYRVAVGQRTREVVQSLRPEQWAELQDADAMQRVIEAGALAPNGQWIASVFGGKSNALILSHTGVAHNFWHLGEAMTVRSLAGAKLPF